MCPQYQKAAKALLPEEYHEKLTKFFSRDLFKYVYTYNALFAKYSFFYLFVEILFRAVLFVINYVPLPKGTLGYPIFFKRQIKMDISEQC